MNSNHIYLTIVIYTLKTEGTFLIAQCIFANSKLLIKYISSANTPKRYITDKIEFLT